MSWGVSAIGKVSAVAVEIERQFAEMEKYPCSEAEPEETVKQLVRQVISKLCAAQTRADSLAVKVSASGQMSWQGDNQEVPEQVSSTISLSFEPLPGFIE